jgi:hypothetical protein
MQSEYTRVDRCMESTDCALDKLHKEPARLSSNLATAGYTRERTIENVKERVDRGIPV